MKIIIKWTSIFLIKIQNSAPAQAGSTVESFLFKGGGAMFEGTPLQKPQTLVPHKYMW